MSDLIPRTAYLHDALGALIGDHVEAAMRALEGDGSPAIRIATARSYLVHARRGVARLQREHGIARTDNSGFGEVLEGVEPTQAGVGPRPAHNEEAA